ncbi:unnamed protein product, partial [Polarella glacialis]
PAGPLGDLPGLEWDAERNRYFRRQAPAGGAASASPSSSDAPAESQPLVAQIPVSATVALTIKEVQFPLRPVRSRRRGRGGGPFQRAGSGVDQEGQSVCPVCLEDFERGEKLLQLPLCSHLFHRRCLEPWMAQRGSCPSCRAPVDAALHVAQQASGQAAE